jgi:hypothetical protein
VDNSSVAAEISVGWWGQLPRLSSNCQFVGNFEGILHLHAVNADRVASCVCWPFKKVFVRQYAIVNS